MTDMRRVTIAFPDDIDGRILALRKEDRFIRCSYSEIVRQIIERGFEALEAERTQGRCYRMEARSTLNINQCMLVTHTQ